MSIHHADNFLDRVKRAMLDAEIMHHADRGDMGIDHLPDHLQAHGIDATADDVRRSIDRLVEEHHLYREAGRLRPTKEGLRDWEHAAGITAHFANEMSRGIQEAHADEIPERTDAFER